MTLFINCTIVIDDWNVINEGHTKDFYNFIISNTLRSSWFIYVIHFTNEG